MAAQNFNNEMGNTNEQSPTFDASLFHRAVLPFKGVLLIMADKRAAQNHVSIFSDGNVITQAFMVVEIINSLLLFIARSRSKAIFRLIYFILQALSFEFLLLRAVYPQTSVAVNLCIMMYAMTMLNRSESFWRQLKEVLQPFDDQPLSDLELPEF